MQSKKKQTMAVSLVIGISLFAVTAFADITAKSGYETYKSAIKNTAAAFTKQFDSFTLETMISLKDNDKVLMTHKTLAKADMKANIEEHTETVEYANGEKDNSYSYFDSKSSINYSPVDDVYNVVEYDTKDESSLATTHYYNPFEEERAEDIEKVFDALVGDLKNYVAIEEKDDGSKEVFGSINQVQIPAVINALASFGVKQFINERSNYERNKLGIPELTDEIYVKEISGRAGISKDDIIGSNIATFVISGKDKSGAVHNITLDVVIKIYDVNSTSVVKPDLTGKKVQTNKIQRSVPKVEIDNRYLGKWKNEVVEVKDGDIVRKAERIMTIKSIDNKYVKGSYTEKRYDEGRQNFVFDFEAEIVGDGMAEFEFTDDNGDRGIISLNFNSTEIFFWDERERGLVPEQFHKVFED